MAVISKDDDYDVNWVRFGSAPLIVTLVLPLVIGVILLLKCIFNHCCVRKSETKEEMFGVEGRMTILPNSDDAEFVPSSSASEPPLQSLVQQQLQGSGAVTSGGRKSPVVTLKKQSQQPLLASNPKHTQPPHERSDSQQSHRSSTKSSNTHSTTILIPNVSPASVSSSSGVNGHPNVSQPAATSTSTDSQQPNDSYPKETVVDLTDSLKRSTLHRQLPDLPQLPQNLQVHHNPPRRSSSVLSHDGTSELYATVGEVPNLINNPADIDGSHFYNSPSTRQSGAVPPQAVASTSRGNRSVQSGSSSGVSKASIARSGTKNEPTPSSDSETYTNAVAHHPYAKLKRNVVEHPYARVRTESVGGDETDTDNYDTPQPYAQTGRNLPSSLALKSGSSTNDGSGPSSSGTQLAAGTSSSSGPVSAADMDEGSQPGNHPIPPRRTRQWRRSSLPQAQDNPQQQHFSGDSQDSRGYTSISVREPLSSIIATRSQVANTRNYDSHYATVSDDSEEMYAAIEDSDGNYMRIPGEDGEGRNWRGGPMVASPIPERREANSPLPPPPIPPLASPPEISSPPMGTSLSSSIDQSQTPSVINVNNNPPLYAQVAKKNKKKKAPVTPTSSNPITTNSSSSQPNNVNIASSITNTNDVKLSTNPGSPLPSTSLTTPTSHSHNQPTSAKSRHTTSENTLSNSTAAALLSPIDSAGSEPRRWSKADISYSEFEVVREPLYNTNISGLAASVSGSSDHGHGHGRKKSPERLSSAHPHHSHSHQSHHSKQPLEHRVSSEREKASVKKSHKVSQPLLDEDNYNVIPDVALTASGRISRSSRDGSGGSGNASATKSSRKISASSYNYQEIEEVSDSFHISNAYQEIERKEPSDYYQEIGTKLNMCDDNSLNNNSNNLYQEIDKGTIKREVTRNSIHIQDDDDDDQEDEFYETVKPAGTSASASTSKGGTSSNSKFLNVTLTSPSHSQASMTSLDRKHGYEKLKKKGPGPTVVLTDILTDYDDDEDEDETKNEDAMYERVKYPPYERLKESRDDLRDIPAEGEGRNEDDRNFYEDIGYSRVKPKSRNVSTVSGSASRPNQGHVSRPLHNHDGDGVNKSSSDPKHKGKDGSDLKEKKNSSLKEKRRIQGRLESEVLGDEVEIEVSNLDQLYARVDKTKKKKHNVNPTTTTMVASLSSANVNTNNPSSDTAGASGGGVSTLSSISEGNRNSIPNNSNDSRMSNVSVVENTTSGDEPSPAFILLREGRDDNSIEYI